MTQLQQITARRDAGDLAEIQKAIEAIRAGKIVIVVDDEESENESDLVIAAENITSEAINFLLSR